MSTTVVTPAATSTPAPSTAQEVLGLIFSLGMSSAAIFVKNPAHIQTAANIVSVLEAELPTILALI